MVAGIGMSENDPRSPNESLPIRSFGNAASPPTSIANPLGPGDGGAIGWIGAMYPNDGRRVSSAEGNGDAPTCIGLPSSALTMADADGNRAPGSFSSSVITIRD